jgi:hypothetical protein
VSSPTWVRRAPTCSIAAPARHPHAAPVSNLAPTTAGRRSHRCTPRRNGGTPGTNGERGEGGPRGRQGRTHRHQLLCARRPRSRSSRPSWPSDKTLAHWHEQHGGVPRVGRRLPSGPPWQNARPPNGLPFSGERRFHDFPRWDGSRAGSRREARSWAARPRPTTTARASGGGARPLQRLVRRLVPAIGRSCMRKRRHRG